MTASYAYLYKDKYTEVLAIANNSIAKNIYKRYINKYLSHKDVVFTINDTIVTGTSGIESSYELNIIKKAKEHCVNKIITIVDNCANFNMRFSLNNNIIDKVHTPDEIWLFDKGFQSDIKYLNDKIIYKKNIYETFIQTLYSTNPPIINHSFVKKNKNKYIVILTEYIYELYGINLGFTEYDFLEIMLKKMSILKTSTPIFLKLHPRERKNKFNILLKKYNSLNIIQDNCDIQELIYYSKVVFGINSSVFIESKLFNIPTYSIQIGSNKIVENKNIKKNHTIYTQEELNMILYRCI